MFLRALRLARTTVAERSRFQLTARAAASRSGASADEARRRARCVPFPLPGGRDGTMVISPLEAFYVYSNEFVQHGVHFVESPDFRIQAQSRAVPSGSVGVPPFELPLPYDSRTR